MSKERVLAVDWGTTFIEFGVIDLSTDRPLLLKNEQGQTMIPNAIWFKNGECILGDKAKRAAPVYPDAVVLRYKPKLNEPDFEVKVKGKTYKGEDLVAIWAKALKADAERQLQAEVRRVVVTVPAYSNELMRERIKTGFEQAGFQVERLLSEPVAASIAYGLEGDPPVGLGLVYDLGGGTFDVALVDYSEQKVIRNAGDISLGGNDFDLRILERWRELFQKQHRFDPFKNPQVKAEWLEKAEQAKRDVSTDTETTLYLSADGQSITVTLTRQEFEALIAQELQRTRTILEGLLTRENLAPKDITQVVPVGGSTRIPKVLQLLSDWWGKPVTHKVDPDIAVVTGAVVIAADLEGRPVRNKRGQKYIPAFKDVTSHGLGVEVIDPSTRKTYNHVMIKSGSELPASHTDTFCPDQDDVSHVEITIIEGDDPDLTRCRVLQRGYRLPIKTPRKKEMVRIVVKFTIDENGLIFIDATEDSGGELHEQFKHPAILGGAQTTKTPV
jgi:molecular chaperone DnaK (HSP70)